MVAGRAKAYEFLDNRIYNLFTAFKRSCFTASGHRKNGSLRLIHHIIEFISGVKTIFRNLLCRFNEFAQMCSVFDEFDVMIGIGAGYGRIRQL